LQQENPEFLIVVDPESYSRLIQLSWNVWIVSKSEKRLLSSCRGVTREGKGTQFPGHYGGAESMRGRRKISTMSHVLPSVHLLPKDLRFDHGGAKLASCPGLHLTSLRPCTHEGQERKNLTPIQPPEIRWLWPVDRVTK